MKKRQIIVLICSMFFFNLLVVSLPAKGQIYERKYKMPNSRFDSVFYERQECLSKNLETIEIGEGPVSGLYCIISRTFNKHGIIYKVDIETGILTIYVGNNLDVIVDYPNKERKYGSVQRFYLFDQRVPVFVIRFQGGRGDDITIPKY
jgi:hypothetical protein